MLGLVAEGREGQHTIHLVLVDPFQKLVGVHLRGQKRGNGGKGIESEMEDAPQLARQSLLELSATDKGRH